MLSEYLTKDIIIILLFLLGIALGVLIGKLGVYRKLEKLSNKGKGVKTKDWFYFAVPQPHLEERKYNKVIKELNDLVKEFEY